MRAFIILCTLVVCASGKVCQDSWGQSDCNGYKRRGDCGSETIKAICSKTCGVCTPFVPTRGPPVKLPAACGVPQVRGNRVIGGEDAVPGSWPWQILLMKEGRGVCGGTLISPMWVLTAAHCVSKLVNRPGDFTVRVGEHDRRNKQGNEVDLEVVHIIMHPNYDNPRHDSDIALLRLDTPAKFGKFVQPACIPENAVKVGTECYLTGWGKIKHPGPMHHTLQQVKLPIVDDNVCYERNKNQFPMKITKQMVCAGHPESFWNKPKSGGCHGDSGGPLVCKVNGKWNLHGAVSYGSSTCDPRKMYSVFARVSVFRDWILDSIRWG